MNLEEIEAKAEELLRQVLGEDHASRAEHAARKLKCLELAARIKSTVAFRKEREAETANRLEGVYVPTWAGQPAVTLPVAEPTKPAVDRLHELVSYLITESERAHDLAGQNEIGEMNATAVHFEAASKAYDDAATKLQEILQEGGL